MSFSLNIILNTSTNIPNPDDSSVFKKPGLPSTKRASQTVLKENSTKKLKRTNLSVQPIPVKDYHINYENNGIKKSYTVLNGKIEGTHVTENQYSRVIRDYVDGKPQKYMIQDKKTGFDHYGKIDQMTERLIPEGKTRRPPYPFDGSCRSVTIENNRITSTTRI